MKCLALVVQKRFDLSPPARGAWIEIQVKPPSLRAGKVAPRTGGVD